MCPASEELPANHFTFWNLWKSPFQGFTIFGLLRVKNIKQLQYMEQHMLQCNYCYIYGLLAMQNTIGYQVGIQYCRGVQKAQYWPQG